MQIQGDIEKFTKTIKQSYAQKSAAVKKELDAELAQATKTEKAKKPAKTQNITIAKPIMPIVESNNFPYKPSERLNLNEPRKRITKETQTGPSRINA